MEDCFAKADESRLGAAITCKHFQSLFVDVELSGRRSLEITKLVNTRFRRAKGSGIRPEKSVDNCSVE